MKKSWILLFLLLAVSVSGLTGEESSVLVEEAWARESPPLVTTGAAYMTVINQGEKVDRLLGVSGEVADRVELHAHSMEEGVMKMRRIDAVEVGPEQPTMLEPGGLHVMLIGLKQPLAAGHSFPLTLNFERAGEVVVDIVVRGLGASQETHP